MAAIDLLYPTRLSTQTWKINIPSYSVQNCDGQTMFKQGVSSPSGLILMHESLGACSGSQASTCAANKNESLQTDGSNTSRSFGHSSLCVIAECSCRSNTLHSSFSNSQLKETSIGLRLKEKTILGASLQNGSSRMEKAKQCRKLVVTRSTYEELRKAELDHVSEFGVQVGETLVSQDHETARKAGKTLSQEKFQISKRYSPRPRPNCPVKFITVENLDIRKGKSLSWKIMCTLPRNTMVIVDQLKGRRARLKHPITGWVSMYKPENCRSGTPGTPQLIRVCEK